MRPPMLQGCSHRLRYRRRRHDRIELGANSNGQAAAPPACRHSKELHAKARVHDLPAQQIDDLY